MLNKEARPRWVKELIKDLSAFAAEHSFNLTRRPTFGNLDSIAHRFLESPVGQKWGKYAEKLPQEVNIGRVYNELQDKGLLGFRPGYASPDYGFKVLKENTVFPVYRFSGWQYRKDLASLEPPLGIFGKPIGRQTIASDLAKGNMDTLSSILYNIALGRKPLQLVTIKPEVLKSPELAEKFFTNIHKRDVLYRAAKAVEQGKPFEGLEAIQKRFGKYTTPDRFAKVHIPFVWLQEGIARQEAKLMDEAFERAAKEEEEKWNREIRKAILKRLGLIGLGVAGVTGGIGGGYYLYRKHKQKVN